MVGVLQLVLGVVLLIYLVNGKLENVALKKETKAGTSYTAWLASNAVDGDNDINGESRTCYHGWKYPSYWTVDLGQEYQLYEIRVFLRNNYEFRTANSSIYLDNNSSRVCYTFPSTISDNPTNVICNETGRYVTIRNPGSASVEKDMLNICEVEIYGCSNGTYGLDCNSDCNNCLHCNRWSGVCNEDCYPGWRGDYCNISCSTTTYGRSCNKQCSDRNCMDGTASCDHFTGSCECGPGWKGVDCREECDNLHYGVNCSRVCRERKCFGNSSCDHVTGSCDQGCELGWELRDCIAACDREHYGPECSGVCASRHCVAVSSCSRTTGQCDGGCQSGWTGIDCTDCHKLYYGMDCTRKCDDRHCNGNTSCNATGSCDKGCKTGWIGIDCTDKQEEQPTALVDTSAVVAGIVTVVLGVLIIVVTILTVVWRRRKGRSVHQNTSKHIASNTVVEASEMRRKDTEYLEGYGNLNDMSRDHSATYTEISSLDTVEDDIERVARDVTTGDVYEPVEISTYEKLNTSSRDTDADYTDLQRKDSYVNVKRTGACSTE